MQTRSVEVRVHGKRFQVDYDPNALCHGCNLPVVTPGSLGVHVCVWCATGRWRTGRRWNRQEARIMQRRLTEAR